jgi:hydrogenase/urease accessory protein HupE
VIRRFVQAAIVGSGLLLGSAAVEAHLASTGLGPVYDGISHLLLSIDDLLPVVAMALLAGLNGPLAGRWALFVLPVAWLAGGAAGFLSGAPSLPAGITSVSLLLLGGLVAADRRLGWPIVAALAAALGLLHGGLNGASIALAGREASGLAGIAGAVFVLAALVSAGVLSLRQPWARIVVRVAGSWIAATGLLLLGWSLSGRL